DRPPAAETELVGQPRLLDRVEVHLPLAHRIAAARALQLGEHVQHDRTGLHRRSSQGRPLDGRRLDPDATSMNRWKPLSAFHFTLSVSSLERSIEFYTAVGFRVLRNNADVIWPDYVAQNFGLARAQGRGALLGIGDGPLETRLDLIQWLEPLASFPDPAQLA